MTSTSLLTTEDSSERRGPGRVPRYGEPVVPRKVGWPPALLAQLEAEAAWRGAREGKPSEWNVSRLVVDICQKHFEGEPRNGTR